MQENKLKYLTIGVFALAIINVALIGFMVIGPKPHVPFPPKGNPSFNQDNRGARFLINQLDLSADQQKQFKQSFQEHRRIKDSLEREIHERKAALADLALGEVDSTGKDALIIEITDLNRNLDIIMYDHFTELKDLCNEEQVKKLSGVLSKMHKQRGKPGMDRPH